MKLALLVLALTFVACRSSADAPAPWHGEVERWGTLAEALREGHTEARVAVADVAHHGVDAVGALEGLRGEITVLDGEVWVSEGHADAPATKRGATTDARATVLFAAEVRAWRRIPIERAVAPSELDELVARCAAESGLDVARPFPFRIEGGLVDLHAHVIAGECPVRARALGRSANPPAFEASIARTEGRLVGIHSSDSAGVMCHHTSSIHAHVLLERDGGWTGHVESVGLAAGAVLSLPLD